MSRLAVQRLLTMLTLALALVVPSRARAAIVPACEDERVTLAPETSEPSCTVVTSVDGETGEMTAAPICDPRGASTVAPPRILPVADDRIDAAPGCHGSQPWQSVAPNRHSPVPATELANASQQALPLSDFVFPVLSAPVAYLAFAPIAGGPRAGVGRGVYHPPR